MSRESWSEIKNSKNFNVNIYRRALVSLIASLSLTFFFGVLIFYIYLSEPERDYYATNGVTSPVKLTSLPGANMSSKALLDPDPPTEIENKLIPQ